MLFDSESDDLSWKFAHVVVDRPSSSPTFELHITTSWSKQSDVAINEAADFVHADHNNISNNKMWEFWSWRAQVEDAMTLLAPYQLEHLTWRPTFGEKMSEPYIPHHPETARSKPLGMSEIHSTALEAFGLNVSVFDTNHKFYVLAHGGDVIGNDFSITKGATTFVFYMSPEQCQQLNECMAELSRIKTKGREALELIGEIVAIIDTKQSRKLIKYFGWLLDAGAFDMVLCERDGGFAKQAAPTKS